MFLPPNIVVYIVSGKTFTILGEPDNPGIIPRALEYIFRTLPLIQDDENVPLIKPVPSGNVEVLDRVSSKQERLNRQQILNASFSNADKTIHAKTYRYYNILENIFIENNNCLLIL